MKFLNLFPTVILGEKIKDISFEDLYNYKQFIKSEPLVDLKEDGTASINQQVLASNLFGKLKKEILDLSKKYLDNLNHSYEDLQISNSWVNVLNQGNQIHSHTHCNSYISGVFYMDYSSPIMFENPLLDKWVFSPNFNKAHLPYTISPEPNLLILFPSWLRHLVNPSDVDDRISIAFNIIPKGEFGPPTGKLYL